MDGKGVAGPGGGDPGGMETHAPCNPRLTHPRRASSPRRFTPHALNTSSCVRAPSSTAPKRKATSGPPPGGLTWGGDGLGAVHCAGSGTLPGRATFRRARHDEGKVNGMDGHLGGEQPSGMREALCKDGALWNAHSIYEGWGILWKERSILGRQRLSKGGQALCGGGAI